jgi:hypothetical protein
MGGNQGRRDRRNIAMLGREHLTTGCKNDRRVGALGGRSIWPRCCQFPHCSKGRQLVSETNPFCSFRLKVQEIRVIQEEESIHDQDGYREESGA